MDLTTVQITGLLPASPARVYGAWLDAREHTSFTGGRHTEIQGRVGAPFSAYDGRLWGKVTKLRTNRQLAFSIRGDNFPDGVKDSKLEITLTERPDGTSEIRIEQSGVPIPLAREFEGIWLDGYFTPMRSYFTLLGDRSTPEAAEAPSPRKAPEKGVKRPKTADEARGRGPKTKAAPKAEPAKRSSASATTNGSGKATVKARTPSSSTRGPKKPAATKAKPAKSAPKGAKKTSTKKAPAASKARSPRSKTEASASPSKRSRTTTSPARASKKATTSKAAAAAARSNKKTAARTPKKASSTRKRS